MKQPTFRLRKHTALEYVRIIIGQPYSRDVTLKPLGNGDVDVIVHLDGGNELPRHCYPDTFGLTSSEDSNWHRQ